jgi:hypothetical protein
MVSRQVSLVALQAGPACVTVAGVRWLWLTSVDGRERNFGARDVSAVIRCAARSKAQIIHGSPKWSRSVLLAVANSRIIMVSLPRVCTVQVGPCESTL